MRATMTAALLEETGTPFNVTTIARPKLGHGQVLVRIAASGTNPLDTKIHAGAAPHARHPAPAVLGIDLAGTIVECGEGVSRFQVGDDVYGMTGGVGGLQGSLAEFAAVDADLLALKPSNLDMRHAAALPLIAITAWEGLVDRIALSKGETLLIQGGAGGVGHIAVQIGLAIGAKVYATGSPNARATIEKLGAEYIDRFEPVAEYVARLTGGKGFDAIYDTVGGTALDASFAAVRRFGRVASCLGWGTHLLAPLSFQSASYSGVFTLTPLLTGEGRRHHGEILDAVRRLVEAGDIAPVVDDRRFTLDDLETAYALIRDGGNRGKIVIDIGVG